jgi:hypothetical protein
MLSAEPAGLLVEVADLGGVRAVGGGQQGPDGMQLGECRFEISGGRE